MSFEIMTPLVRGCFVLWVVSNKVFHGILVLYILYFV